jgi:hypothetical protein
MRACLSTRPPDSQASFQHYTVASLLSKQSTKDTRSRPQNHISTPPCPLDKKYSSSRKWDKLGTLVDLAGGRPHEKARDYVLDKAWDKAYSKSYYGNSGSSSSYWSTSSTNGSTTHHSKSDTGSNHVHFTSDTKKK